MRFRNRTKRISLIYKENYSCLRGEVLLSSRRWWFVTAEMYVCLRGDVDYCSLALGKM